MVNTFAFSAVADGALSGPAVLVLGTVAVVAFLIVCLVTSRRYRLSVRKSRFEFLIEPHDSTALAGRAGSGTNLEATRGGRARMRTRRVTSRPFSGRSTRRAPSMGAFKKGHPNRDARN